MASLWEPLHLFVLYDEGDQDDFAQLDTHLALLRRRDGDLAPGLIADWHPGRMAPGSEVITTLEEALAKADVLVPLLSARFFANQRCDYLLRRALDKGRPQVVPVLLASYVREEDPTVNLQPLPASDQPVHAWPERDAAWSAVVAGLRDYARRPRDAHGPFTAVTTEHLTRGEPADELLQEVESFCVLREQQRGRQAQVRRERGREV